MTTTPGLDQVHPARPAAATPGQEPTAQSRARRTVRAMTTTPGPNQVDLTRPLWNIDCVAKAFFVEVDTVREYTYRADFPLPRKPGACMLWLPDEVMRWFIAQPTLTMDDRRRQTDAPGPRRSGTSALQARPAGPAVTPQVAHSTYKPRRARAVA
jgi:hypothetical protein